MGQNQVGDAGAIALATLQATPRLTSLSLARPPACLREGAELGLPAPRRAALHLPAVALVGGRGVGAVHHLVQIAEVEKRKGRGDAQYG